MPPPEDDVQARARNALWLPTTGANDAYGVPVVSGTATEILVRWNPKRRVVLDANGNTVAVDGTVLTGQALNLQDVLWLGGFSNLLGTATLPTSDFHRVVVDMATEDYKGRVTRYEYGVVRCGETLPPTA